MKDLSKEDLERLLVNAVADIAYAVGYVEGIGKPSKYLSESLTFFNKEILPNEPADSASKPTLDDDAEDHVAQ